MNVLGEILGVYIRDTNKMSDYVDVVKQTSTKVIAVNDIDKFLKVAGKSKAIDLTVDVDKKINGSTYTDNSLSGITNDADGLTIVTANIAFDSIFIDLTKEYEVSNRKVTVSMSNNDKYVLILFRRETNLNIEIVDDSDPVVINDAPEFTNHTRDILICIKGCTIAFGEMDNIPSEGD